MRENSVAPLDWPALVDEAKRRRKAEGLSQETHANLARVSVPTMISFDRKKTSLSLAKALDILAVVGLVSEAPRLNSQDAFVQAAENRWEELVTPLADNMPARFPHGAYSFDYALEGVQLASPAEVLDAVRRACHRYTGWPVFWVPERKAIAPYPLDGLVECWLGNPEADRAFPDAAHADFWRASPDGRLYLRRGYQEDSTDGMAPGEVFDLTLPIWRTAEGLLHSYHLAEVLGVSSGTVRFRAVYSGLAGRRLKAWANPGLVVIDGGRCMSAQVAGSITVKAGDIRERLTDLIYQLLERLYQSFEFFSLPPQIISDEIETMINRSRLFKPQP